MVGIFWEHVFECGIYGGVRCSFFQNQSTPTPRTHRIRTEPYPSPQGRSSSGAASTTEVDAKRATVVGRCGAPAGDVFGSGGEAVHS